MLYGWGRHYIFNSFEHIVAVQLSAIKISMATNDCVYSNRGFLSLWKYGMEGRERKLDVSFTEFDFHWVWAEGSVVIKGLVHWQEHRVIRSRIQRKDDVKIHEKRLPYEYRGWDGVNHLHAK